MTPIGCATVVEPLTEEWVDALAAAVKDVTVPEGMGLVVEYRVDDGFSWHLVIGGGAVSVVAGTAESPEVAFCADRNTALALAGGTLDPLRAIIDGDLTIHGDPRALVTAKGLLEDIDKLFATVRPTSGAKDGPI
ncbi:MAG TPA: hypothetical protein DCR10_00065 [Acidimicrobiaceae bacterium]|nr:hypothetical protein [Acidimicrobiaceae bacterium]